MFGLIFFSGCLNIISLFLYVLIWVKNKYIFSYFNVFYLYVLVKRFEMQLLM